MSEIQTLVETLVKCQSKSHTLIEIGTALNEFRSKCHYTDQQLEGVLDTLKGQLERKSVSTQPIELLVSCVEQFRKQFQRTEALTRDPSST